MALPTFTSLILSQATPTDPAYLGGVAFTKLMIRYESLMITSAAWVIIQALYRVVGAVANHPLLVRLKPMLAVVLSIGMAFLPSFRLGAWDETLLYGITLGSLTGLGQKIIKQTLLGKDYRIHPVIKDPELRQKIDEYLAVHKPEKEPGLRTKLANLLT
jgi:hypothetical protein